MLSPRGLSDDDELAGVRHGQRQRHSHEHRDPEAAQRQGRLPSWPKHDPDHCDRLLLCKTLEVTLFLGRVSSVKEFKQFATMTQLL